MLLFQRAGDTMAFSWLNSLVHLVDRKSRGSKRQRAPRQASPRRRRLQVEFLEARTLPAPINWTGAVDHSLWTVANNWDLHRVPASGDDVTISNGDTVAYNTTVEINTLALSVNSGLSESGGTLTIDAASTL